MRISNRDFASRFTVTTGQRGQQTFLQPMLCTQEEGGPRFYHGDIVKKQLRKDHSGTGEAQTLRYISSAFTYPDKMLSLTALSFLLISFD